MGNQSTVIRQGVIESVFIRIILTAVLCNVFKSSLLTFSFASFLSIPALAYGDSPNLDISGVNTYTQGTSSYEQLLNQLENTGRDKLNNEGWECEYIKIINKELFREPSCPKIEWRQLIVLAAARLGNTRLIDNVEIIESNIQ